MVFWTRLLGGHARVCEIPEGICELQNTSMASWQCSFKKDNKNEEIRVYICDANLPSVRMTFFMPVKPTKLLVRIRQMRQRV